MTLYRRQGSRPFPRKRNAKWLSGEALQIAVKRLVKSKVEKEKYKHLNAKVATQETPGVTGKFGLRIWNQEGQRLIEFYQENALVLANTLFQ